MGISTLETRYAINGMLDTSKTVLDNLTQLCNAAGSWLTYDIHEGRWSVIINQPGVSTTSFNNSNIIGPININGTGLYNLYNKVVVSFPHQDLKGQKDVISIELPQELRNANEPDNTLNLNYDIITNPIQAQLLGFTELKQSRVSNIITFRTDHSKINVKAGDLIDITNDVYGFTNKMFRVVTVKEVDAQDDSIQIDITALEYDPEVYNPDNLEYYLRSDSTGIIPIGAIQAPNQCSITKHEQDSRPRITIQTQMNGGIADTMEFWISYNVPPDYNDDANRTYTLLTTAKPLNGTTFQQNETVTVEFDSLSQSQYYIKARATNGQAVSPYSTTSGLITYVPVQTTQNIDANTTVNNGLLAGVGILTLLNALAGAYNSDTGTIAGSGGASGGTTFLVLKIENFNTNVTYNPLLNYSKDLKIFRVLSRVLPATTSFSIGGILSGLFGSGSTMQGLDQTSLSQMLDSATGFGGGGSGTLFGFIRYQDVWPAQFQPEQMDRQYMWQIGDEIYVNIDRYRKYYPNATDISVEIRGYWQKNLTANNASTTSLSATTTQAPPYGTYGNAAPVLPSDPGWETTSIGTSPVRVRAEIYTYAQHLMQTNSAGGVQGLITDPVTKVETIGIGGYDVKGNFLSNVYLPAGTYDTTLAPYSWFANGVGHSANVTISEYIYPEQLGNVIPQNSIGQGITTFKYNFSGNYLTKQSFNTVTTTPDNFVQVPTSWDFVKTANVITDIKPTANLKVSSIITSNNYIVNDQFYSQYNTGGNNYVLSWLIHRDCNPVMVPLSANVITITNSSPDYPGTAEYWLEKFKGNTSTLGLVQVVNNTRALVNGSMDVWDYNNLITLPETGLQAPSIKPETATHKFIPSYWGQLNLKANANVVANSAPGFGNIGGNIGYLPFGDYERNIIDWQGEQGFGTSPSVTPGLNNPGVYGDTYQWAFFYANAAQPTHILVRANSVTSISESIDANVYYNLGHWIDGSLF